jgi:hypothetical protein
MREMLGVTTPTERAFRRRQIEEACDGLDEIEAGKEKVRAAFRELLADHFLPDEKNETADWWLAVLDDTLSDAMAAAKSHHETLRGYYE